MLAPYKHMRRCVRRSHSMCMGQKRLDPTLHHSCRCLKSAGEALLALVRHAANPWRAAHGTAHHQKNIRICGMA